MAPWLFPWSRLFVKVVSICFTENWSRKRISIEGDVGQREKMENLWFSKQFTFALVFVATDEDDITKKTWRCASLRVRGHVTNIFRSLGRYKLGGRTR
mmetsp:Transcript_11313/g.33345  ORF Transcript_11313/g.33345 Transcript_11313/m.33345 type:complete len:98 (-) Transcript_11313:37-330(-)